MKSFSLPHRDQILADLGDDLLQRLARAVDAAREDYNRYSREHPDWVADATERGSAAWIHDRILSHLRAQLDDVEGIAFLDREPHRRFSVNSRYVFRIKRHGKGDCVSSYPTEEAMAFWANSAEPLDGLEVHNLALGYRWDSDLREFGTTVISYRTDKEIPQWVVELRRTDQAMAPVALGPVQGPTRPLLDLSAVAPETAQDEEAGS